MPKLTYPLYSTRNGWSASLPPRQARPVLSQDLRADFVVIGAGFTGVAIARRLAEADPEARIVLLEADEVGEGSSGRNSGFTAGKIIPAGAGPDAGARAAAQNKLLQSAWDGILRLVAIHGIDAGIAKCGSMRGAATDAGEASLRQTYANAKAHGYTVELLDSAEIARRTGSDYYRIGTWAPDTCLVQPAALIRGLADSLPQNVALYEKSPVLKLARAGNDWRIETAEGVIHAQKVFFATNAFVRAFGHLKLRMAGIHTYAAVTAPVPEADLPALGAEADWGLLPCHRLGTTLRRMGRDRLMVRSLYAYENELPRAEAEAALRLRFVRRWPGLSHVPFEFVYGGTTAFTMNGAPWWGDLDTGLYASGGCNGSGIAKGTMLGTHLADLALGQGDHAGVRATFGTASLIAPEPFRSLGFRVISAVERRKAGLES